MGVSSLLRVCLSVLAECAGLSSLRSFSDASSELALCIQAGSGCFSPPSEHGRTGRGAPEAAMSVFGGAGSEPLGLAAKRGGYSQCL